jgi:transposase
MKDARSLSPDAQEALRLQAVTAVKTQGLKHVKAAKMFGVTRQTIDKWMKKSQRGGKKALRKKKRGRPSESSKIAPRLAALIVHIILTSVPEKHGCTGVLWTRKTIGELIEAKGGPALSRWTVGRLLKKWKLTPQKPAKRALEQNPKEVRHWLEMEYPRIVAKAKRMKAEIHWEDETGLRSDHQSGTTYGRKGKTPVVSGTGKRFSINMLSTITNKGFLRFMTYTQKFTAPVFIDFLQRLIKDTHAMPFIIMDRHPVHYRSKQVKLWLKEHRKEILAFFMPGYSPQMNPVELLNQDLKANALGSKRPATLQELKTNVRSHLRRKQRRPSEARAYFNGASVRYAAQSDAT